MSDSIVTVGIYLTEDERRLLTMLASDLEVREESALRCSEGPEAKTCAATEEALRKLMHLPAARVADSAQLRSVVRKAALTVIRMSPLDVGPTESTSARPAMVADVSERIADRVAAQFASVGLSTQERATAEWLRKLAAAGIFEHVTDPIGVEHTKRCRDSIALLDRLLTGVTP